MTRKRLLALTLALAMMATLLAGCGGDPKQPSDPAPPSSGQQTPNTPNDTPTPPADNTANLTAVQKIIAEAEGMTMEELAKKAIEESNGATFYGVGNSSRGKSALPLFNEY